MKGKRFMVEMEGSEFKDEADYGDSEVEAKDAASESVWEWFDGVAEGWRDGMVTVTNLNTGEAEEFKFEFEASRQVDVRVWKDKP